MLPTFLHWKGAGAHLSPPSVHLLILPMTRTYYKFKGKAHSSEHLLRFLNMVCNQHDDKVWTLSNAGKTASAGGFQQSGSVLSANQNSAGVAAGGALVLLLVATGFAVRKRAADIQVRFEPRPLVLQSLGSVHVFHIIMLHLGNLHIA